jgi:hypothetical protein
MRLRNLSGARVYECTEVAPSIHGNMGGDMRMEEALAGNQTGRTFGVETLVTPVL